MQIHVPRFLKFAALRCSFSFYNIISLGGASSRVMQMIAVDDVDIIVCSRNIRTPGDKRSDLRHICIFFPHAIETTDEKI